MDIFFPDEELEKAPVVERQGKGKEWGKIEISKTPRAIYVKARARNGLYLSFEVEEIRLLQGEYTAVLKPRGFRKYPWETPRQYREGINLENVVIPQQYKEAVERMLEEGTAPPKASRMGRGRGEHLPMKEYLLPLLESLAELGGRERVKEVIERLYEKVKDNLTDDDRKIVSTGEYFWENRAHLLRFSLKERGYLRSDSPRGIWELSDEGWRYLKELKGR